MVLAGGGALAACNPPQPVHFAHGSVSTELTGGIPRGERDCFTIGARQGQHLTVAPSRPEDSRAGASDSGGSNIVLQLYRPPWKIATDADGVSVTGAALPGAAEGRDTREWSGALPLSGDYLLVVGTSWGGGEYRLRVEIR
jgi:hypothetical protein